MSEQNMHIMAYTPPTNGKLEINGIRYYMGEDFRTLERYREYRDCGFDILMQAGETKYSGEPFETSELKYMMDLAQQADLKFLVFDQRIIDLAGNQVHGKDDLICGRFQTRQELQEYLLSCMEPYMEHPAFYGVILGDEPTYASAYNLTNVCDAMKAVKPGIYMHNCFLPALSKEGYASPNFFPNEPGLNTGEAFRRYIEAMISTGIGPYDYDDYPFGMWKGKNAFNKNWIRNLQIASETTKKCNTDLYFTIQSFSGGVNGELRKVNADDIMFQVNMALGFAVKQIAYFTYWRFQTRPEHLFTSGIMNDDGSKIIYDEVQGANAYIQQVFPYIQDCSYQKTQLVYCGSKPRAFTNVKSKKIDFFESISASEIALVNELANKDERAYMVFNATDPYEKKKNHVELLLKNERTAIRALVSGKKMMIPVVNGKLTIDLAPGEAVWLFQ